MSPPSSSTQRIPVLFVGHGSPMNAIEGNRWSRGFAALGKSIPKPRAILAVSAHWYVDGTRVTANEHPRTIHDFYGFPDALFAVEYPAPGDPALAERVVQLVGADVVFPSTDWGLDHGTWSVLVWMFPNADIPVVQLAMDRRLDDEGHLELGRKLAPLRDEGILILASGNVVHNLHDAFQRRRGGSEDTPPWARDFDETVRRVLIERDTDALLSMMRRSDARRAHPTPEHWVPLIYSYAASDPDDDVDFPIEGFDWGSLSMRAVRFGRSAK